MLLPPARARLLPALPIAGREVLRAAFGADGGAQTTARDLCAVIGWDGLRLRILAVELLDWRGGGAEISARLLAAVSEQRLILSCVGEAAAPLTQPYRVTWNDILGWQEGAPLRALDPHRPHPGTWQAQMAATRARVVDYLAEPRSALRLAALAPLGLLAPFATNQADTAH